MASNGDGPIRLLSEGEEARLLKDIAESLNEANDVSSAMSAILPRLSQVLGLKTAWAFRYDPQRATFVEVGASGLPPALSANNAEALRSSWCECQDRMVKGHLDTAVNIVRCSRLRDAIGDKQGLKYHASIPLKMNGRPLGILNVAASGAQVFTRPALDLLRAIGFHVAVTIDRAALMADMKRRNQQLESLGLVARELTGISDRTQLLQQAINVFAAHMGFEGVGLFEGSTLLCEVVNSEPGEVEYSYRKQEDALLPPAERKILADACSALSVPIPHYPYEIRVEARNMAAFGPIDEEILNAFAWYLTTWLEQTLLHRQALDAARWAERRQLAADLHDSVSQHLFSAQLIARTLRQRSASHPTETLAERLESVLQTSRQEMRRLIQALRPDSAPLTLELRHRLIRLHSVLGSRLSWNLAEVDWQLPGPVTDAVLRIIDEALQNAMKHAPQAAIRVILRAGESIIVVRVIDQGPGFNPSNVKSGYGLNTMRDRAQAAGLRFRLTSQARKGTKVTIVIPKEVANHH